MQTINNFFNIIIMLMDNFFIVSMIGLLSGLDYKYITIKKSMLIILLTLTSFITNDVLNKSIFSTVILILFLIPYCYYFLNITIKKSVSMICVIIANIMICNVISIIIGTLFTNSSTNLLYNEAYNFIGSLIIFFNKLILIVEYFFIRGIKVKKIVIPEHTAVYFIIMEILQIIIVLIFANNYISFNHGEIYTICAIVFFCIENIILYKIAFNLSSYFDASIKNQLYIESLRHEQELIDAIQQKYNFINRWNHDLKNTLLKIQTHLTYDKNNLNKSIDYLEELIEKTKLNNEPVFIQNSTINYVLYNKINQIKKSGIDAKIIVTGKIPDEINDLTLSMLITAMFEIAMLISQEYYTSGIDLVIRIDDENRQVGIKTINYCNGAKRNDINIEKIKKYEISKIKRICDDHNGMYHELQQDDEIIAAVSICF